MREATQEFETLFRELYPGLVQASARICGERPLAEDVVQQAFVTFWERGGMQRAEQPAAYLRRAVVTRTLNALRDRKRLTHPGDDTVWSAIEQTAPAEGSDLAEVKEAVHRAIAKLPERARIILILHRFEGLSYKEIAAELDIAPKTVENQLARSLKLLRNLLPRTLGLVSALFFNSF